MKKSVILLMFFLICSSVNLFSQSNWGNVPQSTQFSPTDIEFTDLNNGWAATISGYIAHTNDGGNSWSLHGDFVEGNYGRIDMISSTHGYSTGWHTISETIDGENWQNIYVDTMSNVFKEVNFLNDTLGTVLVSGYMIWKTIDGGQTWDTIFFNPNFNLEKLQFVNDNMIIAVGQDVGNGNIILSQDGGLTWIVPQGNTGLSLTDVYFIDNQVGFIVGQNGVYLTSIDGGLNWQSSTQFQNLLQPYPSIYFTSATTGYVMAEYGQSFRTVDGGITWTDMSMTGNRNFQSLFFLDSLHGWAASSVLTEIISTTDGGVTWSSFYTGSGWGLTDIEYANNTDGWACGIRGTLLHTIDEGATWSLIENPLQVTNTKIEVSDSNTVWIINDQGSALYTNDNGLNWSVIQISPQGSNLFDIDFPTSQIGYVVGSSYRFKTIDGGSSWVSEFVPNNVYFSVDFFNIDSGFTISGDSILRTLNAGAVWENVTPAGSTYFNEIVYPAQDTAYVVGYNGLILSTYDNGNNWVIQNSGTTSDLTNVSFSSSSQGRVSGYDGTILVTFDAGMTWIPEATPSQVQISAVVSTPNNQGWASKVDGNLLNLICLDLDSTKINSFTLSPSSNCNGIVKISTISGESFVTNLSGQNEVVYTSSDFYDYCEGVYSISGYNSCGNGLNGQFVIPDPAHFFAPSAFLDSNSVNFLGNVQEFCGHELDTVFSAELNSISYINDSIIEVNWEITTTSGLFLIPASYHIYINGVYSIQLSLFCNDNSFEGLVVSENIYIENNTVLLSSEEIDNNFKNLIIYPIPASHQLFIKGAMDLKEVYIYSVSGQFVQKTFLSNSNMIDISNLEQGTYYLKLIDLNGQHDLMFIKN